MLFIYMGVAAILIFGGILAYFLGVAYNAVSAHMIVATPSLAVDQGVIFLGSIWHWFVLLIIIAALLFVIVNSQRQQPGVYG